MKKRIFFLLLIAACAALAVGVVSCKKSESEEAGKRLGSAVRDATEDVKGGAQKVADGVKDAGKNAWEGTRDFGKGVKEGLKAGDK